MIGENQDSLDRCWAMVLNEVKYQIKKLVKEAVEEVISDKMSDVILEDKRLTADDLCERWTISRNTLLNWEKDGRIASLPLGGRRKIYSMKDVLTAEAQGLIKTAS